MYSVAKHKRVPRTCTDPLVRPKQWKRDMKNMVFEMLKWIFWKWDVGDMDWIDLA